MDTIVKLTKCLRGEGFDMTDYPRYPRITGGRRNLLSKLEMTSGLCENYSGDKITDTNKEVNNFTLKA